MMRHGRVRTLGLVFLGSVVVFGGLVALLVWPEKGGKEESKAPIMLYCAAGLRRPVDAAAAAYEKAYGVKIQVMYEGSASILAKAKATKTGDLYLPADESYIALARQDGLINEVIPLARMRPVLGVKKGNPKKIASLEDAMKEGVKISQANPDAAAIGKVVREGLRKSGQWDRWQKAVVVQKGTVNEVAIDVKVGAADAAFVWDATVKQMPDLEGVEVAELKGVVSTISVAVLNSGKDSAHALRFARFLGAKDRGLVEFSKEGYEVVAGDVWAERPSIHLMAGAMLRPAVEPGIIAFEKREGVSVTREYNGCGILVGSMKTGKHPDAYFACDRSFMVMMSEVFPESSDVSMNQLVILVKKGNPLGIRSLADLGKEGLRLGIGHEKQCALGAITAQTLKVAGQERSARKNVVSEMPAGDMLVNQLLTGSLDAAIVYISNATASGDKLEPIKIDMECALAVQPVAVAKDSKYPQLTSRLVERFKTRESKDVFVGNGFKWLLPE